MAASMRNRFQQNAKIPSGEINTHATETKTIQSKPYRINLLHWVIILSLNTLIMYYSHLVNNRFPEPLTRATSTKSQFVEENARIYLDKISSFGPRPVGSKEAEYITVDYLLGVLTDLKDHANPVHDIQIDSRRSTGSFNINFKGGFTSVYHNVNNIVAKLGPRSGAKDSLLVNCHYDSVINGTGASDDAVSCSLMLEVLRILSTEDRTLKHNVIFIFNGAEENIVQASHGFITSHPWASSVRAFINLEAAGAGGREILFQAGPENPWLVQLYADNVPYPYASVIGQEIFESGVIPSDTDFRIYRDYGKVAGLDIAYMTNGYVYHTPHDLPEMIPPGCIQRGGENLLSLVRALGSSPYLTDPGEYRHGKLVYFDVLGRGMVIYPQRIGTVINLTVAAIVFLLIGKKAVRPGSGTLSSNYLRHLVKAVGVLLASWTLTLCTVALLGFLVDLIGQPMSWFTNSWLLIGLYAAPSMLVLLFINEAAKAIVFDKYAPWEVEALFYEANLALFSVLLSALTLRGISSAVALLAFVVFPLGLRYRAGGLVNRQTRGTPHLFFAVHMLASLLAASLLLYTVYNALILFIPIMGRTGTGTIPDIFIGIIVAFAVVLSMSYHLGLVYVSKSTKSLQMVLVWIWLVSVIMATVTPLGFPYGADPRAPTKQRHNVLHIERTFHDHTGYVFKHDSGLLHVPYDRSSVTLLRPHLPPLAHAELTDCRGPYCGWPYLMPLANRLREAYYIPSSAPKLSPRAYIKLVNSTQVSDNTQRWSFHVTGPNHIKIYLSPKPGVSLPQWSLDDGTPYPTDVPPGARSPQYFIFYSYGIRPEEPWTFWVDVQEVSRAPASTPTGGGLLEVALAAHYITTDGETRATPELDHYLGQFPDWTTPVGWAATYEMWTF